MQYLEGTLGGNQYRNTVRKNWQLIPKYRVENRRNTDTAFMIGHAFLTLYPSRLFFISSMYTPEINLSLREKTWDLRLLDVLPISPTSNHQKLCIHLPLFTVKSKVFQIFRRGQIPWRIFFALNTVSQKDETCIPQGWMIPQYRTFKLKLPKYRLKKAQYRNTTNPYVPLYLQVLKYTIQTVERY